MRDARVRGLLLNFSTCFAVYEACQRRMADVEQRRTESRTLERRRMNHQPKVSLLTTMPPLFRGNEGQADCLYIL